MNDLPEKFIENMKKQLPEDEWEAFLPSMPVRRTRDCA